MSRPRSPGRDKAFKIWQDSQGETLLKDIGSQLNIPEGQIRKWKSLDKWELQNKGTLPNGKGNVVKPKERVQKKNAPLLPSSESEELSPQERLFCEIYDRNHNATQAYIKAYKATYNTASSHAYEAVGKRGIKNYLEKLRQQRREAFNLEPFDIVERMMMIAFSNIGDYVTFGSEETDAGRTDYVSVVDSAQVDTSLISEISQGRDGVKIKLNDQFKALEWCANYFELNPNDRHRKEYDDKRLEIEREKLDVERKALEAKNPPDDSTTEDDGFLNALEGKSTEVWAENQDIDDNKNE